MVDSTKNTRKVSFQKRPAEVELIRKFTTARRNALAPFREELRLIRELDAIHKEQNCDETGFQALMRRLDEELERPIEKGAKVQRKRRREKETEKLKEKSAKAPRKRQREEETKRPIEKKAIAPRKRRRGDKTESPAEQADEVQRNRRREEETERPTEKRANAPRKRRREEETECPAEQADEFQRKSKEEESEMPVEKRARALRNRRREEESERPLEKRAKRKRRGEAETECPAEQADEVPKKKGRLEKAERPIEKRTKAPRKRRGEDTECPAEPVDEVPKKKSREEKAERLIEKRTKAPRKKRGKKDTECPTEQVDEVPKKKSREEKAERPIEKRTKAPRKRRGKKDTECPTEQVDEVPKKKSREEKAERPIEKRTKAQRKRRGKKDTECPTEQVDEVPKKKSREEKAERPIEKRTKAPRKRKGEKHTECPAEQVDEVPRKKSREEEAKRPTEKRAKAQRKRGREEDIERRKQEIMERLVKIKKEQVSSQREKERMEKEARVLGCLYPESFIFHKRLGSGSHGKVMLATHRDSGKLVAVKIVEKTSLIGYDRDTIMIERKVMQMVMGHPYCTQLYATFQSEDHLFYVMEFYSGADLRKRIESKKSCDLPTMRRLAAELLCGLQYLHSKGVIYGDAKPENILLDCNGHVKLADFGIAETNMFGSKTTTGEFGSELYKAPEIFKEEPFDKAVDYFSLGVTLFEAAFGIYPFDKKNPRASICNESPRYPFGAECVLVDFLNKLLCKDQKKRKAYIAKIRKHRFFRGINWEQLEAGETRAPFSACRKDLEEMTKTTIDLYICLRYGVDISSKEQALFKGFSFVSDEWKAIQKLKTKSTRQKKKLN